MHERPPLYARSTDAFWDDPHISAQMLRAHLDPNTDAASRPPAFIDASVAWLQTVLPAGAKVLDLGCGPGLYTVRLSRLGYDVTGVDLSPRSIDYARNADAASRYLCQNYLALDAGDGYDAALMIWCDYGALTDAERRTLLKNVARALKPGGIFIFDVFAPRSASLAEDQPSRSEHPQGGFWCAEPYTVETFTFLYGETVELTRHLVTTDKGQKEYLIWDTRFTPESLRAEAAQAGFALEAVFSDARGAAYDPSAETLCAVLRRGPALDRLGLAGAAVEIIQEKAGVGVYRVLRTQQAPAVLKTFTREADRREIANYHILRELGIPTLAVYAQWEDALLLEDLNASSAWRLGREADMDDAGLCAALGRWYKLLHQRGRAYAAAHGRELYAETDCVTRENIEFIMRKTGTESAPAWKAMLDHLDGLTALLAAAEKTLTYNDFYYTNLAVARDGSAALMFDYNLLGVGLAASDLRNVVWSLGSRGRKAFLAAYGPADAREALLDQAFSVPVTLYAACQREAFPQWAAEDLAAVRDGRWLQALRQLTEGM